MTLTFLTDQYLLTFYDPCLSAQAQLTKYLLIDVHPDRGFV